LGKRSKTTGSEKKGIKVSSVQKSERGITITKAGERNGQNILRSR